MTMGRVPAGYYSTCPLYPEFETSLVPKIIFVFVFVPSGYLSTHICIHYTHLYLKNLINYKNIVLYYIKNIFKDYNLVMNYFYQAQKNVREV